MAVNEPAVVTDLKKVADIFQKPPDGGEVRKTLSKVRVDPKIFFSLQFFTLDLPEDLQEHLAVVELGPAHSSMLKIPWAVYVLPKYKGLSVLSPTDLEELETCKTRTKIDAFFEKHGGMRCDIV